MTDWQPNAEQEAWWTEYARRLDASNASAEPEADERPVIIESATRKDDQSEWPKSMRTFHTFASDLDFELIPFGGKYGSWDRKLVEGSFQKVYTEHEYLGVLGIRRADGFLLRAVWTDGKIGLTDCKVREPGGMVQYLGVTELKKRMVQ